VEIKLKCKDSRALGITFATSAALCWGLAIVISKLALSSFPPVVLLVIQLLSSSVLLWTILAFRKIDLQTINRAAHLCWLGLLEPGIAYLLGLIGLSDTLASGATLIEASEAVMINSTLTSMPSSLPLILQNQVSFRHFLGSFQD
jgi:drug/metabolite transporter (DMT)-like permease